MFSPYEHRSRIERSEDGERQMFQCERFGEIRSFDTFSECQRFVRREGDANRLWSYIGTAQLFYIASMERV